VQRRRREDVSENSSSGGDVEDREEDKWADGKYRLSGERGERQRDTEFNA